MPPADKTHFNSYRIQTFAKHRILERYLPVYFGILGSGRKSLIYFDGFAGPGFYEDADGTRKPGSPVRALRLISARAEFADKVVCIFVEKDEAYARSLEVAIAEVKLTHPLRIDPLVVAAEFEDGIEILEKAIGEGTLAPCFLFVDPCGIKGVTFERIVAMLSRQWCEVFIFFNYDGINRMFGDLDSQANREHLTNFFGDAGIVNEVARDLEGQEPKAREEMILRWYLDRLRQRGEAKYLLPFRVEDENRARTSHYLIHATKHVKGFTEMKRSMRAVAREQGDELGRLELLQSSPVRGLFHPDETTAREELITAIGNGLVNVGELVRGLCQRPTDMLCEYTYKEVLKDLEARGEIEVLDRNGILLVAKNRMSKGKVTMGDTRFVRQAKAMREK